MSSALPQLLRLIRLIVSGISSPASSRRPTRSAACRPSVISVDHVGELQLDQLVGGEGAAELLAVERVLAGGGVAGLGRAHRAPADAVAGAVEAAERALEALDVGQQRVLADLDLVHHDLAGDRGAQATASP